MKGFLKFILPLVDIVFAPLVVPAAILLKIVRLAGVQRMRLSRRVLLQVGVFPIANHYFEPLFNGSHLRHPLHLDRNLPGIQWNVEVQLDLLSNLRYSQELEELRAARPGRWGFDFENAAFTCGDADYFYNVIRLKKPARIFEIGSGHSTRLAMAAIRKNEEEAPGYRCRHVCIEPYEQPWLEKAGVTVVRRRVEELGISFFAQLEADDLLFIDSSHVIRPQGDLVFEYLELLSTLKPGVIVHIHDIFSPRDYPAVWVKEEVRLWNEQYLLEAFLTGNRHWEIIGAVNYLYHNHFEAMKNACPCLTGGLEPGSFYIRKVA
ncbi:MAG TPA: class I SAM-dependent methyltransferase, partial [Geomonas sp.]|nr:class I SAM-dependent methyltransferase [Geomonas sp.]